MSIRLPLNSIANATDPITPGQIVYGMINRVPSYAIAIGPSNEHSTTRLLLHSVDGQVQITDASLTTYNDGGIIVGTASSVSLRIHDLVDLGNAGDYLNLLGIDSSAATIVGRMTNRTMDSRPTFVALNTWRIVSNDNVTANGHFWASSWDLAHVDNFGNETIILQGRCKPQAKRQNPD